MFAIIAVRVFPPKESFKIRVSLESLYGTYLAGTSDDRFPFLLPSPASALMQLARASNDRLMFAPSNSLCPRFSVLLARSLPAKSMSESLPEGS